MSSPKASGYASNEDRSPSRSPKRDRTGSPKSNSDKPAAQPLKLPFTPHTEMPEMEGPIQVVYSPFCGLPADFVQYGNKWEAKDKPWVMEHFPEYYPELTGLSLDDAKMQAEKVDAGNSKVKELPGGKKVKDREQKVLIQPG